MTNAQRSSALPSLLFGGQSFSRSSASDLKRAAVLDAIALLLLLLGLAGVALGQSQDPGKDQKQTGEQASSQGTTADAQRDSTGDAASKAKAKKPKKVYGEEDLAKLKGGVSVVGDPNAVTTSGRDSNAVADDSDETKVDAAKENEKLWRQETQKIHAQMDAVDEQIKNLKEEIKKNGASGFDLQKGLKDNVVYIDDKNAHLQQLENKRKALEQGLDRLQEAGRKAGVPSDWVR